jgi:hypothetical protein
MAEMSRADAELAYRYLGEAIAGDIEHDAYDRTIESWRTERPEDYETLEAAYNDPESTFAWKDIDLEPDPAHDGDLSPVSGVIADEEEIRELADDFAWDYLNAIRDEVRAVQELTAYSPREFVALVLDAAENTPEEDAHRKMGISLGNYRGKKGTVNEKYERATQTVSVTDRIRRQ